MRSDLLCYENYICYVTNEAIYMVTRNDVGSFDLLTIDRTARMENLVIGVERYADEADLYRVIPFAATAVRGSRVASKLTIQDQDALSSSKQQTVQKAFNAYGIVGFVRFLHGYYVLVISERSQVATIGHHAVFEIDKIETIYIPVPQIGVNDANEMRYLKTFQNGADLTSNFYLSYTYDMTRTLQSWIDGPPTGIPFENSFDTKFTWNSYLIKPMAARLDDASSHHWVLPIVHGFVGQGNVNIFGRHIFITVIARRSRHFAGTRYLKRGISTEGFVANEVEIEQIVFENPTLALSDSVQSCKSEPLLTDGFGLCSSFVQLRGSVPALWTQDTSSMSMVGPPPISVFGYDLGMQLAGRHFSQLLTRYGAPVVVLDLVKTSQKSGAKRANNNVIPSSSTATALSMTSGMTSLNSTSKNSTTSQQQVVIPSEAQKEALLHEILNEAVDYLNQFLEPAFRIQYIHIDLAHVYRKDTNGAVTVRKLLDIGDRVVASCGICTVFTGQRQKGVLRTNCVDCLDRTNAAQLAAGLVALGHQFFALGATAQPTIELDSYCFRLFELLFEEMGDILSLQYGSSLLVHHFATYRRSNTALSQSRDKLEQVSRLLNNTFSDADRQSAFNLLLGMFRPFEHHRGSGNVSGQALWDMPSDYDLHNPLMDTLVSDAERRRRLVQWFDLKLLKSLPFPAPIIDDDDADNNSTIVVALPNGSVVSHRHIDSFTTYFQPGRMTFFEDMHDFKIPNTLQLTPAGGILLPDTDLDPFVPRIRRLGTSSANASNAGAGSLLRRFLQHSSDEIPATVPSLKPPSLDGFDSSPLVSGGSTSDGDSEDSQDNDLIAPIESNMCSRSPTIRSPWPGTSYGAVFKSQSHLYGFDLSSKVANPTDAKLFNTYCYMADFRPMAGIAYTPVTIVPISSTFRSDIDFLNATVPAASVRIYEAYVRSSPDFVMPNGRLWEAEDRSQEYIAYMRSGVAL